MATYTLIHVLISLVGIASGLVVVAFGLVTGRRLDGWTALFLTTTLLTSLTGFGFPFTHVLPSHVVGVISLVVLGLAIFARYGRHLASAWRWIYVVNAVLALYLNVFVLIVQAFLKITVLKAAAPTQSEPAFLAAQLLALGIFVALGVIAAVRFHPESIHTAGQRLRAGTHPISS
jgi:hypothetical protein